MLEHAFDNGITHFDVARMYGYGEAESALGDFLEGRRDRVTVTTKFGILPPRRSHALRIGKAVARAVVALNPRLRTAIRARASQMISAGHFDAASARQSLETSLRELRTDYVDLLLLHECRPENLVNADALLEYLDSCITQGKVRAFGIATDIDTVQCTINRHPRFARVTQFPNDAINRNLETIDPDATAVVTHSPVGEGFRRIQRYLADSSGAADLWSSVLGIDARDATELGRLMLAVAVAANPRGVVVFSSLQTRNIEANASVAAARAPSDFQLSAFRQLVSGASPALRS
jgi:aryl-alcohol dehydrogenase-like predicted oxidoreductase